MVTQPDHDALCDRVRALEARLDAGLPTDIAVAITALRGVCAGNPCAELRVFGARMLDRLDQRLRPVTTRLERAGTGMEPEVPGYYLRGNGTITNPAPNNSPEASEC